MLNNHPFDVSAYFKHSIVLTYSLPKELLIDHIPEPFILDTFQDKFAFVAVAIVETQNLRPSIMPSYFGNNFILIGIRIFVKYININQKKLRGLFILKSQTNKKIMEYLGNCFTKYKYDTIDISLKNENDKFIIVSNKSKINILAEIKNENIKLPIDSPFQSWSEARRFAGPLPFTFSFDEQKSEVLIVEGVRENWIPKPLQINHEKIGILEEFGFENIKLASSFIVSEIPYYWKKGKIEKWKKN
jgi:hypothetical protein